MSKDFDGFIARFKPSFASADAVSIDYRRSFTIAEYDALIKGYIFGGDDDGKWIIIPRSSSLYFYAIPLKLCFVLHLQMVNDKWQPKALFWDSANFKDSDAQHIVDVINFLIDLHLLRINTACPFPIDLPQDEKTQALYRFALVGNVTAVNETAG